MNVKPVTGIDLVATIRPDKTLCDCLFRQLFPPQVAVIFLPATLFREKMGQRRKAQVFIQVVLKDVLGAKPVPVPLYLLDFSRAQMAFLCIKHGVNAADFRKYQVAQSSDFLDDEDINWEGDLITAAMLQSFEQEEQKLAARLLAA